MRSWLHSLCSAPVRVRISAAPPHCSPDAHPLGFLPRRVSGEQQGGAAEILTWTGAEHRECTQLRIRRLLGAHLVEMKVDACPVKKLKYDAINFLFDINVLF